MLSRPPRGLDAGELLDEFGDDLVEDAALGRLGRVEGGAWDGVRARGGDGRAGDARQEMARADLGPGCRVPLHVVHLPRELRCLDAVLFQRLIQVQPRGLDERADEQRGGCLPRAVHEVQRVGIRAVVV